MRRRMLMNRHRAHLMNIFRGSLTSWQRDQMNTRRRMLTGPFQLRFCLRR
jgi:hypothetical protein